MLRYPADVDALLRTCAMHCSNPPACLGVERPVVLEITERFGLNDVAALKRGLQPFLDMGYRLAIDDFGSGVAQLQYLAELPVSFVKIDRRLVADVREPRVRSIVRGIARLANELDVTTIGEGVEDEECAEILHDLGVDWPGIPLRPPHDVLSRAPAPRARGTPETYATAAAFTRFGSIFTPGPIVEQIVMLLR